MPGKPAKPPRRQRRHGDLPAGFVWRNGRPRWVPSPKRREQGWRALDLKDSWGRWLAKGPAIERAQAIADAVAAWAKRGQPVPASLAAIAPKGALEGGGPAADLSPRSIGALLDAYAGDLARDLEPSPQFKDLAPQSQRDYRGKLARFLQILARADTRTAPRDQARIAAVRALPIDILLPPPADDPAPFILERAYDELREEAGDSMAYAVLGIVSAWLAWCVRKRRIWPTNPAQLVRRKSPEGRIVVWDWPELVAMVRQAEAMGLASIADAIVLAVDLSWSPQDLMALTWGQIAASGHVRHRRIKTGVAGNPPLLAIGRARIEAIRARWADAKVRPTHVLICEMTGRRWNASTFRGAFVEIREQVAKTLPDMAGKQFRDLRDTAVTYGIDAGLEVTDICSRTLHNPVRAQAVISKHYGAIRQGVADRAALTLDAHFEKMGYSFDQKALPAPQEG